jgi:hypothetical protein
MSIEDLIVDKVSRGMLHPLLPKAAGSAARRALFVSEELNRVLDSPEGDTDWERRVAELRADLEFFVEGSPIDPKYLFLLYPARDAVWEIRSARNDPSIRVLGLFAGLDVFVATHFALRADLGGWQSREWKAIKRAARARWRVLFHAYSPLDSTKIDQLVTGALDGRYFKA